MDQPSSIRMDLAGVGGLDPRQVATRLLGPIDWQSEVSGVLQMPGSGRPEHRTHFRSVSEWYQVGPVMGNYTCGASFKPGCCSRSNDNLKGHRFLVVESDTLGRDEVGAIFRYLQRRLHYSLHCIVDTAGKSLHAWFDAPPNQAFESRLGREDYCRSCWV